MRDTRNERLGIMGYVKHVVGKHAAVVDDVRADVGHSLKGKQAVVVLVNALWVVNCGARHVI